MKRTIVFLPDELHERLWQEAFTARISTGQVIRRRLESCGRRRKSACADPLAKVEGIVSNGHLTEGIDESLYSSGAFIHRHSSDLASRQPMGK